MKNAIKYIPNILTSMRLIGAASLIFIPTLSLPFMIVYTFCGITDVFDGVIARAANASSEFGSKLDSLSDLVFYSIMIIKLMPILLLKVSKPVWIWAIGIVALRVFTYTFAAFKFHRFSSIHTYFNKLSGLVVFLVPYSVGNATFAIYHIILCAIITLASFEELIIHITNKEYDSTRKSVLHRM